VGMWTTRVLCELSKLLWKSFCDFHRSVISAAARFSSIHLRPTVATDGHGRPGVGSPPGSRAEMTPPDLIASCPYMQ